MRMKEKSRKRVKLQHKHKELGLIEKEIDKKLKLINTKIAKKKKWKENQLKLYWLYGFRDGLKYSLDLIRNELEHFEKKE